MAMGPDGGRCCWRRAQGAGGSAALSSDPDSGLWRDKMQADGSFVDEPAPASSLYHITVAWEQVRATATVLPEFGWSPGAGS